MAIKWIDGFEAFDDLTILRKKWASSSTVGGATFDTGRAGYRSLNLKSGTILNTPDLGSDSTWTIGFAFQNINLTGSTPLVICELKDDSTTQLSLRYTPDTELFQINRGVSVLGTGSVAVSALDWWYIEWQVTVDAAGSSELRIAETTDILIPVDNTQVSVNSSANKVTFNGPSDATQYLLDDIYILDSTTGNNNTFLGDNIVEALYVIETGEHADWKRSASVVNYEDVQHTGDGYIYSSTPGDMDTYTLNNLTRISSDIKCVVANIYAENSDSTQHDIASIVRSGMVDYISDTTTLVDPAWRVQHFVYEADPDTGLAWTINGLNAAEFGVRLIG